MKTMSITKIALALLVSIPALSLNGAAVATTVAPSLWKSFCSRTQALTSRAMSGIKSGAKAGFVGARNFVANHKTASKYSAIAAATSLLALVAYKGYTKYTAYQAKKAEPVKKTLTKTLTPAENLQQFVADGKKALAREKELAANKVKAEKEQAEKEEADKVKAKQKAKDDEAALRASVTSSWRNGQ